MRFLLAGLVLTGLSFVVWGVTGVCRYLYERDRDRLEQATYVICVAALGSLAATALVIASHLPAALLGWEISVPISGGERGATAAVRLSLVACGCLGIYAMLRVFAVRRLVLAGLAAGPLFAVGLDAIGVAGDLAKMSMVSDSGSPGVLAAAATVLALALARLTYWRRLVRLEPSESEPAIGPERVAAVICAHDEEAVIGGCLERVLAILEPANVFVASDGSSDRTVEISRDAGCQVLDIHPNGGKARALAAVLDHFEITRRFEAVLILDADAEIDPHYLERALPLLDDPSVVAVAGHANPKWFAHIRPRWKMLFAAYRVRLYALTQALLRYGQTWKLTNVSFIIPGFASLYRARVLADIDIAAPGLSVEDFNMTFEIHHKRLGKIAYSPAVCCTSQEAHGLVDYVKQVRRWYLGFWQTVRRHGVWPSFFWLSLGTFVVEMLLASVIFLSVPLAVSWFLFEGGTPVTLWLPPVGVVDITVVDFVIAVLLADYAMTAVIAVLERKPVLLVYGIGFSALRYIDAALFLYTLPLAFVEQSDGRWSSPRRLLRPDSSLSDLVGGREARPLPTKSPGERPPPGG